MAITDLTGYTWVGNTILTWDAMMNVYSISFTSVDENFNNLVFSESPVEGTFLNYITVPPQPSAISVYDFNFNEWTSDLFKTIQITGGTDATNSELIAWLEANGTLTPPTPQPSASISIGTLSLAKAFVGNSEVASMWLGNVKLYEKASADEPYLTFSSPSSFTLKVTNNLKYWDGTLEYSTDTTTWNTWSGTTTLSSASDGTKHNLYLRGTGNTYITGSSASSGEGYWVLTGSNISCSGNIENLLDYATVALGNHPVMASYCYAHIFRNCSSLTTAPSLPATTLANYCYRRMFYGCTSLTTTPALPATTLASSCYEYMFYGCTNIKLSTAQDSTYINAYRIPTTGTGTTALGALTNMFSSTGGTFTGTPTINTTYYTSNTVIPAGGNS